MICIASISLSAQNVSELQNIQEFKDQTLQFTAKGGLALFTDESATVWKVLEAPEWCPGYGEESLLNIKCRPNETQEARNGKVIVRLTYKDGNATKSKDAAFTIQQAAMTEEEKEAARQNKPAAPVVITEFKSGQTVVQAPETPNAPETYASQPIQTSTTSTTTNTVNYLPEAYMGPSALGTYNGNSILGAVWTPSGVKFNADGQEFSTFVSANFIKIQILNGYTTSLIKADALKNTSASGDPQYVFSGTCALLNGEMRIGGGLFKNLDLCLLGTYAWLPDLNKANFIKFNYMSGWNWFVGLELCSNIPVINGSVRLGWQGLNGQVSMYDKEIDGYSSTTSVDTGALVLSLGITLGGNGCKGYSILRLF